MDDGLLLAEGEEEIILCPGEKKYLRVRDYIWKYPVLSGLDFSSQNPTVAYVDRYGWIRAVLPGKTVLSVWHENGDNGNITVTVLSDRKLSFGTAGITLSLVLLIFALLSYKKVSLF